MKKHLFLLLLGGSLAACGKADEQPRGIEAPFDTDFHLFYQQKASLATTVAPELTVAVDQLEYYTTPAGLTCCFGPCAWWKATVLVGDASGATRTYTLNPDWGRSTAAWQDSLHVRANGNTYVVYAKALHPGLEDTKTKVQYRSVQLVVSRLPTQ